MKTLFKCVCVICLCFMASISYAQQIEEEMKRFNDYQFIPNFFTKDKNTFKILDTAAIMTPKKYPLNLMTVCVDGYKVVVVFQSNGNSSFQLLDSNGNGIMCKKD